MAIGVRTQGAHNASTTHTSVPSKLLVADAQPLELALGLDGCLCHSRPSTAQRRRRSWRVASGRQPAYKPVPHSSRDFIRPVRREASGPIHVAIQPLAKRAPMLDSARLDGCHDQQPQLRAARRVFSGRRTGCDQRKYRRPEAAVVADGSVCHHLGCTHCCCVDHRHCWLRLAFPFPC